METLFIKLDHPSNDAQWVIIDSMGKPHAAMRRGSLASIKDFSRQRRIVCTVPSTDIYLDKVTLPDSRNRRKFQQAVPFALEDDLADDIDIMHFAIGKAQPVVEDAEDTPDNDNKQTALKKVDVPVAAINKEQLQSWLSLLADADLKPHELMPDVLALPFNDNEWSIFLSDETALIRTGKLKGFACDPVNLRVMLDSALPGTRSETGQPSLIRIWNHSSHTPNLQFEPSIQVEVMKTDQTTLATFARGYSNENHINLLQGEFSFQEEYGKLLSPWRVPALLLAILIAVLFIGNVVELFKLKTETQTLSEQIRDTYKEAFPQARNIVKPRFQMEQKLKSFGSASQSESIFLTLFKTAATQISAKKDVEIQSINFNGERLDIELSVANLQNLDELKQALDQQTGISTEIQSASAEGSEVTGRLRITQR